jgi:predicted ester cyclase
MKKLLSILTLVLLALPLFAATKNDAASNRKTAEAFVHEVYDLRSFDAIPKYVAASFVDHSPGAPADAKGPEYVRKQAENSYATFPDLKFQTQRIVAENDLVAIHWKATGTTAPNAAMKDPGGKSVTLEGISMMRFDNGKIVESWDLVDRLGMFTQLGYSLKPNATAAARS